MGTSKSIEKIFVKIATVDFNTSYSHKATSKGSKAYMLRRGFSTTLVDSQDPSKFTVLKRLLKTMTSMQLLAKLGSIRHFETFHHKNFFGYMKKN